jgi:monoamine oxidase
MNTEALYDTIIVGSGVAGLYTAIELLKRYPKSRVAIFEKHKELGGRAHTFHQTVDGKELQWEAGAGRISTHHEIILHLLKRYKLTFSPIGGGLQYKDTYTSDLEPDRFQTGIPAFIDVLAGLPQEDLQMNTVRQLLTRIHGAKITDAYLIRFPYRAEVDIMRADMALKLFAREFRKEEEYGICVEGLSALVDAMRDDVKKRGGTIHTQHTLLSVEEEDVVTAIFEHDSEEVRIKGHQAVLAIPSEALKNIKPFAKWDVLKHLKMQPLLRFYGAFPKEDGKVWYEQYGGRIVTSEPLRYIIPGSASIGSVHMSYTDSQDATYWIEKLKAKGEKEVGEEMLAELRKLLRPSIPPPYFVKAHAWEQGVTYWLPGRYDPAELSKKALRPFESMPNVHICGESFSVRQGWMEGAVEHAAMLLKKL